MENNVSVLDQGLAATNALYYNAAVVVIVVLFAALSWFITTKVRKSDTLKTKLNEFGYDESHFEKLVLGAITHAEKLATMAAKKAIDKNTHSIDFLKTVDPELIDKYGEQEGINKFYQNYSCLKIRDDLNINIPIFIPTYSIELII